MRGERLLLHHQAAATAVDPTPPPPPSAREAAIPASATTTRVLPPIQPPSHSSIPSLLLNPSGTHNGRKCHTPLPNPLPSRQDGLAVVPIAKYVKLNSMDAPISLAQPFQSELCSSSYFMGNIQLLPTGIKCSFSY